MNKTKQCRICSKIKNTSEFHKNKGIKKDGLEHRCKECRKEIYQENKTDILNKKEIYYKENKTEILEKRSVYYKENKEKILIEKSVYYKENKEQISNREKIYRHYPEIKKRDLEYRRKRHKRRQKTDVVYVTKNKLKRRLNHALKGENKSAHTLELLGCSVEFLLEHLLQTAIQNGYLDFDINNYSGKDYHIDHIKPCASFDLSKPEEQQKCFHWTNLQILTAKDNMKKSDKIL